MGVPTEGLRLDPMSIVDHHPNGHWAAQTDELAVNGCPACASAIAILRRQLIAHQDPRTSAAIELATAYTAWRRTLTNSTDEDHTAALRRLQTARNRWEPHQP